MLPKDHRGLAGKDVTEYPSSNAGDDTQKGAEEAVVSKTSADGHVDSGGSEKPKSHCVQEIHDIVIASPPGDAGAGSISSGWSETYS